MPAPDEKAARSGSRGTTRRGQAGGRNRRSSRALILSAAGPAVAVLVVVVFAGFALLGSNGLLSLEGYRKQLNDRNVALARYEAERDRLQNQKHLIERGDPDFADELVRRNTDMIDRNEYMVVEH